MSLLLRRAANQNVEVLPLPQGHGGDGRIGYSVRPTKVYRPFDRDIEAIQEVLERAAHKPTETVQAKPKRKREIVRAIVAETVKAIEGDGLIASAPVRQEIKQAAFELLFPAIPLPVNDDSQLRAAIEAMLQRAAEAAYQQQIYEYEQMLAFEADEEDAICLLLAS